MFEIESSEPKYSTCECCGGGITSVSRFISKDGYPFALYHATFADNHRESGVLAVIGIDSNWEEVESLSRIAFAFRWRVSDDQYVVSITDKAESPWSQSKVIGRILDRDEALSNSLIEEVYHLTDHILLEDITIKNFLDGELIH